MRRSLPRYVLTSVVILVVTRGGGGCAAEQAHVDAPADAADGVEAQPPKRDAASESAVNYDPGPLEGWDAITDYPSDKCRLYVAKPATAAALAPIWEPCSPVTPSAGAGCRQLKLDWERPTEFASEWMSGAVKAIRRSPTSLSLMLSRGVDRDIVRMIVDVDGAVQSAFRQNSPKCGLGEEASSGDYFVYKVFESDASGILSSDGGGAIGGRIGERPRTLFRFDDKVAHSYMGGPPGIVQTQPPFALNSWSDSSLIAPIPLPPADASLYLRGLVFVGDTLHFGVGSLQYARQKVWSLAEGTRDLLTFGNDATRGYSDLGTDGVHLVWNQGQRTDISKAYPRLSTVVSPYGTSSSALVPRVLRSDITGYGFGTSPFVVGCGYAARWTTFEPSPGQFTVGTLLVRLSDGHAWTLPDGDGPTFRWRRPVGITCDELFSVVEVGVGGNRNWNVARVRIDSLGPPTAP